MMTVKHITLSGEETVFQTTSARFTPVKQGHEDAAPPTVWFEADGVERPLTGGTVFVMNDHGKTVARYDIGASMVPLDALYQRQEAGSARGPNADSNFQSRA